MSVVVLITTFGFLFDVDVVASVKLMSDLSDFVEDPVSCLLRRFPFCKDPGVVFDVVAPWPTTSIWVVIIVAGNVSSF